MSIATSLLDAKSDVERLAPLSACNKNLRSHLQELDRTNTSVKTVTGKQHALQLGNASYLLPVAKVKDVSPTAASLQNVACRFACKTRFSSGGVRIKEIANLLLWSILATGSPPNQKRNGLKGHLAGGPRVDPGGPSQSIRHGALPAPVLGLRAASRAPAARAPARRLLSRGARVFSRHLGGHTP